MELLPFTIAVLILFMAVRFAFSGNSRERILRLNSWLFERQKKLLSAHFEYYRNLNDYDKKEFLIRLNTIIKSKRFIAMGNSLITSQMKTLIAASITQLTFGFKNYLLPHYRTIFIYPEAYLNPRTKKLYKGETNTNGFITLSWNYFMEGYRTGDDRKNLGLHETAHALLNTIIYSNLHDPELDEELLALDKIPDEEKQRLFTGNDPFFRDYAKTNVKEFFAVAVECFFETPETFKLQFPEFYNLMCRMLNQDPVNRVYKYCIE